MTNLTDNDIANLRVIVNATNFGSVAYLTADAGANLLMEELVDCNAQMVNVANPNEIAFRARQTGIDLLARHDAAPVAPAPSAFAIPQGFAAPVALPVDNFVAPVAAPAGFMTPVAEASRQSFLPVKDNLTVGSGFVAPSKPKRAPSKTSTYSEAISRLALNDYIFVPATEERPDPRKALGSTITAQNKRYADFNPRRYFQLFRAVAGQQFGSVISPADGVFIVRTDVVPEGSAITEV